MSAFDGPALTARAGAPAVRTSSQAHTQTITQAVANLDAWLETMRCPGGYGGPVVHWWQNCLSYTGSGLDWRYEGIILGYLTLRQRTGEPRWLAKACRAGDDLVAGQLPNGAYRASSFELNPYSGGTPHEAAADLGLLHLALALRAEGDARWERYVATAERNLRSYHLARLWDPAAQAFRDHPDIPSLTPNKVCTLAEALFALADLRADAELVERYALPALRAVVTHQVDTPGPLVGAIAQNRIGGEVIAKYFPYYIARCIPALLLAYAYTGDEAWLAAAVAAFGFVVRQVDKGGLLPQVIYPRGLNRYPQWVAPLGDVLRVGDLLEGHTAAFDVHRMERALLEGQLPSGGFVTGRHFGAQVRGRVTGRVPDFRDSIPVVGWCDKTFRYLATRVSELQPLPQPAIAEVEQLCRVRGQWALWHESLQEMALMGEEKSYFRWRKGQPWADEVAPEVMWK